jgi:hypothetical protein
MQGLASQLSFAVIDMPAAFDVILGDAWLRRMKAQRTCLQDPGD